VPVLDALCTELTGEITAPNALRLGALLSLHGPQLATNRERLHGLQLAVEQINAAGGVPDAQTRMPRPLALVACDTADSPLRAGRHLIEDLGVPAIIGPNTSEDTLELTTRLSVDKRTLTLSPTAMASSLRDLADADLSWLMVPSDAQRAPLMQAQIHELERALARDRSEPIKLSVLYRDDVFGHGVRLTLSSLTIHGKPLSHPDNLGSTVQISMYAPSLNDMPSLIAAQLSFQPDIVVLAGTAEGISGFMQPFEEQLRISSPLRPHYVLTDGSKVRELLLLAQDFPDLQGRVHGIGSAPSEAVAWNQYQHAFLQRFPDGQPQLFGVATAYDAVYAIGFAAAAAGGKLAGPDLASGLRAIDGVLNGEPAVDLASALQTLYQSAPAAHGALARFAWDERGVPRAGKLEVWCVNGEAGFVSSGVVFELGSERPEARADGTPTCALSGEQRPAQPTLDGAAGSAATQTQTGLDVPPSAASDVAPTPERIQDDDAGVPEPALPEFYAEYRSANANPSDSLIAPWLRVGNRGTGAGVPLSQIKLRYYVTNESNPLCLRECVAELYWAGLLPGGARVPAKIEYVTSGWLTGYLELSFAPDAPTLRPQQYVELQVQFHTGDYMPLEESNDYSYDPAHQTFAEFRRVVVFRDDQPVWGDLPLW
jgi:ABC-type branched-subunit amino acid transport system substrate-binding protein